MKYFTEDVMKCEDLYYMAEGCNLFEKITDKRAKEFREDLESFEELPFGLTVDADINEILEILKKRHEEYGAIFEKAKEECLKIIPEDAAEMLFDKDEEEEFSFTIERDHKAGEIKLLPGVSPFFVQTAIVLKNAEVLYGWLPDVGYTVTRIEVSEENNVKIMRAFMQNDDRSYECHVSFSEAEIRTDIYRIEPEILLLASPRTWDYVFQFALGILEKNSMTEEYLNSKEKKLVPLSEVLAGFQQGKNLIPEFVEEIDKLGLKTEAEGLKKLRQLSDGKYEPLFEKISKLYEDSQSAYPKEGDGDSAKNLRKEITDILKSKGYEGEFPEFHKEIEGKFCTVFANINKYTMESSAVFMFVKSDIPKNKYGVLFEAKGRYATEYYVLEEESLPLEEIIEIIDKSLSEEPLSKEEKIHIIDTEKVPDRFVMARAFSIISLIIGFFVTVVLGILFCGVSVLFTGSLEVFNEIFLSKFWIYLLVSSLIPFGYLMIKTISR